MMPGKVLNLQNGIKNNDVEPNIDIQPAQPFELWRKQWEVKAQGGTLIYKTWKDSMNQLNDRFLRLKYDNETCSNR